MPSDPRLNRALEAFAKPIEQYRSAVAATLEEVRGHLAAGRSNAQGRAERLREQFGQFGGTRIDAGRLSTLLGDSDAIDASALARLERASHALRAVLSRGDTLFHVDVPPGADAAACIRRQLAMAGRAFAAARVANAAQRNSSSGLNEETVLDSFPFSEWTAAERKLTPPLVVTVAGTDLVAGALTPFVDGMQKIVLLVDGLSSPAPLVRLITPGVLVVQAHEFSELDTLVNWPGPAVGAVVPSSAIRFVHDPSAGPEVWERLTVSPSREWKVKRVGSLTAEQQNEELRQLDVLATRPKTAVAPLAAVAPEAAAVDQAERLAAWLLQQANLTAPAAQD